MATLTLTADELSEVRLNISATVTSEDLSDSQINSETILGAAVDYIVERVVEGVDETSAAFRNLSQAAKDILQHSPGEAERDVASFINVVLSAPQPKMFRRAVVYRCAGLACRLVRQPSATSTGVTSTRIPALPWIQQQLSLFELADQQIQAIRDAFPIDIFPDEDDDLELRPYKRLTTFTAAGC